MTSKMRSTPRLLAALLLLGSGAVFAVPGDEAATAEVAASNGSTPDAEATAQQAEPCQFGMCTEARFEEPRVDTLIRSDVMPNFYSPALTPTVEAEAGC